MKQTEIAVTRVSHVSFFLLHIFNFKRIEDGQIVSR